MVRWKWLAGLSGLGFLGSVGPLFWNNVGGGASHAEFKKGLKRALQASRDWTLCKDFASLEAQQARVSEFLSNPALLLMVADCSRMAGDKELGVLVDTFVAANQNNPWLRMLDSKSRFVAPPPEYSKRLLDYQRWFLWVMAPDRIQLARSERADLESPDGMGRGRLTHQLFAWVLYRNTYGRSPSLDARIRHLAERVAGEAFVDFRVTDQYLQRVAFLLYAGHPDLVRPRWVERVLAAQQNDGGWTWAWYGWEPQVFHFRIPEEHSTAHPTAQGLWIVHMLEYRYAAWAERAYR